MKIKTKKEDIINSIQIVQNIITSRTALPILSNILLEAQQGELRLTATDLDIGISCVIPVDTQEMGAITIPAKRFSEIVKELPTEDINITVKKNNLITIETQKCQFKIMGLPKEEFPKLPEFKDKQVIKLDMLILKQMLNLTSFSVSSDETRYILNGILFKITKNNLTLVATDGKRLAIIEKKINQEATKNIQIIIPIKTIHELNRNLKEEGELSMVISANQVLFEFQNITIISRLIEGEFPDYNQVVPQKSDARMKVDREQFLMAVRRAALLSTPDYQAVKLEVFKNKVVLSKSTPDVGESREELPATYLGKELVIGFNPNYITDVLKNLDEEEVEFELTDAEKPAVLRRDGYIYIVLPMRLG
ncbi:MAG: DNA polymerase III subunit beta [Candidatus Omnitrophica bacterium]|nr:DNA polymerase III subunit beta [Candidatus Omnitrophota bacterium]